MFRLFIHAAIAMVLLQLTACAPSIERLGYYGPVDRTDSSGNCEIEVIEDEDIKGTVIGGMKISDNGFSIHCSEQEVITILAEEACRIGADAVYLQNISEPNLFNNCFRVTGIFVKYGDPDTIARNQEDSPKDNKRSSSRDKRAIYLLGVFIGSMIFLFCK